MKRDLIVVLLTFCLAVTLFMIIPIESRVGYYDPWLDLNDDGKIDMKDVAMVAKAYGSLGEPINKTDLLLDLQDRVEALEAKFPISTENIDDYAVTAEKLAYGVVPHRTSMKQYVDYDSTTSIDYVDVPGMSVDITLTRRCTFIVMFSVRAYVMGTGGGVYAIYIKAVDDDFPCSPGRVLLTQESTPQSYSFIFYKHFNDAGTHTVKIQ